MIPLPNGTQNSNSEGVPSIRVLAQLRLDNFLAGPPLAALRSGAAITQTRPDPGSTVQARTDPGPTPRIAATGSGIVTRTEEDPLTVRSTLDVNVAANVPPITLIGGRLNDFALDVGLPIRQRLMPSPPYIIRQSVGQYMGRNQIVLSTMRAQRGLQVLASGANAVIRMSPRHYRVRSWSGRRYYDVRSDGWRWVCSCPDFQIDSQLCIHCWAVELSLRIRAEAEPVKSPRPPHAVSIEEPCCSHCGAKGPTRKGYRRCKKGIAQRYLCKQCGRRFTPDRGFSRIHSDPEYVIAAFDLWAKKVSYRQIAHHLRSVYGVAVSKSSVERWVRKMALRIAFYADSCMPGVGALWRADETSVSVGGELLWAWNVMDHDTRYWLASTLSTEKRVDDARRPLKKARTVAGFRPRALVTDGNPSYKDAVRRELYSQRQFTLHLVIPPIRKVIDNRFLDVHPGNNIMERLQGTQRDLTRVLRGFKHMTSAQELLDGYRGYYNLVRPHLGNGGMTPAEKAGVSIPGLENQGRLMAVLVAAYRFQRQGNGPDGVTG